MPDHSRDENDQSGRRLARADVYRDQLVDGELPPSSISGRLGAWLRGRTAGAAEREGAELDARLRAHARTLTRCNHVAVVSPKGGVGKTTCTFLAGDVLARELRLRVIAVDANPDYRTLGSLAPDPVRSQRSLADLLGSLDGIGSPAELRPFVSPLQSGLHLLAAPTLAEVMATMTADSYRQLVAFLDRFYEIILLDLGTGLTDPIARYALDHADQTLVVSTPEWVTADRVLHALDNLGGTLAEDRLTLILNQAPDGQAVDRQLIEAAFRRQRPARRVSIPYDPRLRVMVDAGAYQPAGLDRATRLAIKQLGLTVTEGLR